MTVYILPAPGVIDLNGQFVPMADERYHFCGQVRYQAQTGQRPIIFCNGTERPPLECSLQGGGALCAFVELAFDWSKAERCNKGQPLSRADYESAEGWQARIARHRNEAIHG